MSSIKELANEHNINYNTVRNRMYYQNMSVEEAVSTPVIKRDPEHKRSKYAGYKHGAKNRGYDFKISYEQFCKLIFEPCHYCGESPQSGIDRVNNTIGYVYDNCVSCCWRCNKWKHTMSDTEFIDHANKISNRKGGD